MMDAIATLQRVRHGNPLSRTHRLYRRTAYRSASEGLTRCKGHLWPIPAKSGRPLRASFTTSGAPIAVFLALLPEER